MVCGWLGFDRPLLGFTVTFVCDCSLVSVVLIVLVWCSMHSLFVSFVYDLLLPCYYLCFTVV